MSQWRGCHRMINSSMWITHLILPACLCRTCALINSKWHTTQNNTLTNQSTNKTGSSVARTHLCWCEMMLQTTLAALSSHSSSHTVPQVLLICTSTRPLRLSVPFTTLRGILAIWAVRERKKYSTVVNEMFYAEMSEKLDIVIYVSVKWASSMEYRYTFK